MKSIFTALFIIASISVIYSCNNSSASSYKQSKSDTTQVVGVFEVGGGQGKQLRFDYMWRICKDTFAVFKIDSTGDETTQKKKWLRDTIYFARFLDTVRVVDTNKQLITKDSTSKGGWARMIPKLDSTGKPEMKVVWVPFPKQLIYQIFEKSK